MSDLENTILIELLETIADNKFVMGDHLVEIGISGPNLEATLSSVAIAQSELGHARILYNWVYELKNGKVKGKKPEIKEQTGKAFFNTVNTQNWISLIANLFTTNVTSKIILGAISDSPYSTKMITKMVKEQQDNIIYARSWCRQLANDKGRIPIQFQKDFENAKKEAQDWLLSWQNDDQIRHFEIIGDKTNVIELFNEEIGSVFSDQATAYIK
ncbi:phenylacetate-CoA oxygenase subunit PaaI [Aquibacillus sp. 3ASR75-11]|uniref:Phenylacetate-CoA oxygenase subunit PaaI n=1 Tax=Terrihalobacillus insolitus TaxID=2950438 RepID=A0A9X4AL69_9BACI|nr:Phenylacetic acid catabolic protein [Terrihalobacillus insolitus]MDC3415171.1 phenylacetate-CoA oxygenase subunit PaaI [Terrihalobacillus insolitus]MDC3424057.1 phenylacetate-CoA oxygenase subunit PaaI [Terrihalobacillus insolitus]